MKPYELNSRCVKCGEHSADSEYIRSNEGVEYIHRTCRNCGYEWKEATLDHENTCGRERRPHVPSPDCD